MSRYSVHLHWSDEDEGFIATSPEIEGVSAFGETPEDAVHELGVAIDLAVEVLEESGRAVPEPRVLSDYSGQLRLRMPKTLHASVSAQAEKEGVSLNALLNAYIAQGLGTAYGAEETVETLREVLKRRQEGRVLAQVFDQSATDAVYDAQPGRGQTPQTLNIN